MSTLRKLEHHRRPLTAMLLSAFLAFFLVPASLVLCFEQDGCISLEASTDGTSCWDPSGARDLPEESEHHDGGMGDTDDHCQLCTDIPLRTSTDLFVSSSVRSPLPSPDRAPSFLVTFHAAPEGLPVGVPRRPSRAPRDTQASAAAPFLRCVRLLI